MRRLVGFVVIGALAMVAGFIELVLGNPDSRYEIGMCLVMIGLWATLSGLLIRARFAKRLAEARAEGPARSGHFGTGQAQS
jgi:hypothetical protein